MTEGTMASKLDEARQAFRSDGATTKSAAVLLEEAVSDSSASLRSESSSSSCGEQHNEEEHQLQDEEKNTTDDSVELTHLQEEPQVLAPLARQLEYYFSELNLSKDTYLQTLRDLNDGCVPVTILSNFCKVKSILHSMPEEEFRINSILQAATDYSDLLHVHSIDAKTGKVVNDDTPSSALTILAVGPISREPLRAPSCSSAVTHFSNVDTASTPGYVSNTIILREVAPEVTEDEVRAVFKDPGCPPIQSIHCDVAHCWFVTLETQERNDVMRVMMQLRYKTLGGEVILARLKASTSAPAVVGRDGTEAAGQPDMYLTTPDDMMMTYMMASGMIAPPGTRKKKKKRTRSKKKKKRPSAVSDGQDYENLAFSAKASSQEGVLGSGFAGLCEVERKADLVHPPPPSFGEDDFPTLQDKKVEFETRFVQEKDEVSKNGNCDDSVETGEGGDDENPKATKAFSDNASTATTTSSSLESIPKKTLGGYAAALKSTTGTTTVAAAGWSPKEEDFIPVEQPTMLNATPSNVTATASRTDVLLVESKPPDVEERPILSASCSSVEAVVTEEERTTQSTPSMASAWCSGRSFAEIVRRDDLTEGCDRSS